jgi:transcriptional regulator with XRE-family HTH domain
MKQLEMPFLQLIGQTKNLNLQWINLCNSETDAVCMCWNKRTVKRGVREMARDLGISVSHLSNIINGKKYLPSGFRSKFQILCGNWAIRQFEDLQIGATTQFISPEQLENQLLKARIEELERAA